MKYRMYVFTPLVIVLILFAIQQLALAQVNKPDTIFAYKTDEKIVVDGILNEESWSKAMKISNFRQRELEEGALPTEKTEVAVLYDDNNLYIGVWAYDSEPDKIIAKEMKRDFDWGSDDNFECILGTYNDSRNGFLFVINPNGARADALVGNEGSTFVLDWNGVWDAAARITPEGWFAEIVIPFSTLSFQKKDIQNWQVNFERNIRRKNEQLMWQGYLRKFELENISRAGILAGLKGIKAKTHFEIKPYVTAGIQKEKDKKTETIHKIGGELNTNITPTLKFNLTVNTDFAQAESDDIKVNLSRFNLYYREKRQFFLEGSNYFEFKTGHHNYLYYSRRIGIEDGQTVPIIAGARLFGKAGKNSIGIMTMQTEGLDPEETTTGKEIKSTNFSVLRYKRDILRNSYAGMVVTSKIDRDGRKNIVYGADFRYKTDRFLGDKNLGIGVALAKSYTDSMDNKDALAYNAYVSYRNDEVNFIGSITSVQKNYNPEMGFVRRHNYTSYFGLLAFKPRFKSVPFIRNFIFIPAELSIYTNNTTGDMETLWYEFTPFGFVTKTGERLEVKYQRTFEGITQPFNIFDTVKVATGDYWHNGYELGLESYSGRRLSGEIQFNYNGFYQGTRFEYELALRMNINKHLNFRLNWDRNYIYFPTVDFIVDEIGSKLEYAFNPKMNTSIFAQYNNESKEVILNYRFNWIPKIGSDFYFVINQIIDNDTGNLALKNTTVLAKLVLRFTG